MGVADMTAGLQTCIILICMALVLGTGAIIGGIAIPSGNDLLRQARDSGDDNVAECLASGEHDLMAVSSRYLHSVTGTVKERVGKYLDTPETLLKEIATLARAQDPDVSTSPNFSDTLIRPLIRSKVEVTSPLGSDQIGYYTHTFSPSHPRVLPPAEPTWGSEIAAYMDTVELGKFSVTETRRASGEFGYNSLFMEAGISDQHGNILGRPCLMGTVRRGKCTIFPKSFVYSEELKEVLARGKDNIFTDSEPLNDPDTVSYSPVAGFHTQLGLWVSYAFTHPGMTNATLRQGGRVGLVFASLQGTGLADIFSSQELPVGSLLYCIDRNPWSGREGNLLASNKGRFFDKVWVYSDLAKRGADVAVPLDVRNHTDLQNSSVPSAVAEHGRYVFSQPGGFAGMANTTAQEFHPWRASAVNNNTLYWTVVTPIRRANLLFYVALLVPRSAVMDTIDTSNNLIRVKAADDRDDQNERAESVILMLSVIVVLAVLGLLAASVYMTRRITRPLINLAKDMACVAVMDLESVDIDGPLSRLVEVGQMQASFRQMVHNLEEFRHYMPQNVLVKEDELTDGSTRMGGTAAPASERGGMDTTSSTGTTPPVTPSTLFAKAGKVGFADASVMRKKVVSVIAFNVKNWHASLQGRSPSEIVAGHAELIQTLLHEVQQGKGVVDVFSGDRVLAAFNAYTIVSTHRHAASEVAFAASNRLATASSAAPELSYAVCSGDAKIGHLGCQGLKKVTMVSDVIPWSVALERYNKVHGWRGLIDSYTARDVKGQFEMQLVDGISFPKRSKHTIKVFELKKQNASVKEEEWMYQLDAIDAKSSYVHWNKTFDNIIAGEWEKATALLEQIPRDLAECSDRLRTMVLQKKYDPPSILYH